MSEENFQNLIIGISTGALNPQSRVALERYKLIDGADNWITNWLSGHILAKIIMGQISEKRKLIAAG